MAILFALQQGTLAAVPPGFVQLWCSFYVQYLRSRHKHVLRGIAAGGALSEEARAVMADALEEVKQRFSDL